jgi:hypothetical protein
MSALWIAWSATNLLTTGRDERPVFFMQHVLSASQFSREEIITLFATADRLK